jgi:hypothetical protein
VRVDLPIPGSPESKTTEPSTTHPHNKLFISDEEV